VPIHDLGYRAWQGGLTAAWARFWPITETGMRLAWQNRPLRRLLFFAWLPAVYLAAGFLLYEQGRSQLTGYNAGQLQDGPPDMDYFSGPQPNGYDPDDGPGIFDQPESRHGPRQQFPGPSEAERRRMAQLGAYHAMANMVPLPQTIRTRLDDRHYIWSWLLWVFFRYPQGVVMVLVMGLVAPSLIAQDVRTRAFLLYFSRPLTRAEYVLGKMATVWAYVALITLVPAVLLYGVAVLMSNELGVVAETWDLPLRITGASLVLIIPTTLMALAFSSLTSETRYASFAWFAVWVLGWVTYTIVTSNLGDQTSKYWQLVSLYHTLGEVQHWVFGLGNSTTGVGVGPAAFELVAIAAVSWVILFRRVSAPMRV
jgi:ABC-type transport system involved in multi-copper enzyme maturation permease subunit